MKAFQTYEGTLAWPGKCICGSQAMPVVDTFIDMQIPDGPNFGRVYLCRICSQMVAHAIDWIDPKVHETLLLNYDRLMEEIGSLRDELDQERQNKVVPMAELAEWFKDNLKPDPIDAVGIPVDSPKGKSA